MPIQPKTGARIRLCCAVLLSALLIITGICLIISCVSIYRVGESPFTRARIAEHLSRIGVPIVLTLVAAVGCAVLEPFLPPPEKKKKAAPDPRGTVHRLAAIIPPEDCSDEIRTGLMRERRLRRILSVANALLYAAGIIASLFYVLNQKNFPAQSINPEIATGMLVCLAGLALPFIFSVVLLFLFPSSYRREADLLRSASAEAAKAGKPFRRSAECAPSRLSPKNKRHILVAVRSALIICGIVFVILGISNGGMAAVVQKAIRICTECIGLG